MSRVMFPTPELDPSEVLRRVRPAPARTTSYGPDPTQVYDVRLPTGPPRDATVVVVHGGFWGAAYDRAHVASMAQAFADDGCGVAVVEYRRVGMPGGGWPGTALDVLAAVEAVHADPVLPARTVLVGHSAGGHLAAWVAGQPGGDRLAGAVSLAGCVDLAMAARLRLGDGAAQRLMGGEAHERPEAYRAADPALTPALAPIHLVHGTDDDVVPLAVSESYRRLSSAYGDPAPLVVVPGCDHYGLIDPEHRAFDTVLRIVAAMVSAR